MSDLNAASPRFIRLPNEVQRVLDSGQMPVPTYLIRRPNARLSQQECRALTKDLQLSQGIIIADPLNSSQQSSAARLLTPPCAIWEYNSS